MDSGGIDHATGRRCFHELVKVIFAQAVAIVAITPKTIIERRDRRVNRLE